MKQKHKYFTFNRYTTSALLLLVIAVASAVVALQHNRTDASPAVKPVAAAIVSKFSFTGTPEWWQGATSKSDIALFHKYDCFVSDQYKTGSVDVAAELQKLVTSQAGGGMITPGAILPLTLQTNSGPQQYQLHQYSLSGSDEKLMEGMELGYLQLPDGYVKIQGNCDTPEELPTTIPALQAIKFDESK